MEPADRVERGISWLVHRMGLRTVAAVAVFLYVAGWVVPLSLHWRTLDLVAFCVPMTLASAVVLFAWYVEQWIAAQRRHLVDWTTNLRMLDAQEFEWFVGELFRREGYSVAETGRQESSDGNIDLVLTRDGRQTIVQCKRWQSWLVGVDEVRKLAGTLMREGLPASQGMLVTLSGFTGPARDEAAKLGLALIDGSALESRWNAARRTEPCPKCSQPMRVAHSSYGWWLRCVASGCDGKRDLSTEPGRAVELLILPPPTS